MRVKICTRCGNNKCRGVFDYFQGSPFCLAYDVEQTAYLEGLGLRVVRFSNAGVTGNWEGVCGRLEEELARSAG